MAVESPAGRLSYTRADLYALRTVPHPVHAGLPCSTNGRGQIRDYKWRLPVSVVRSLRDNGICAVRKTRRGRRARKTTSNDQLQHFSSCKSESDISTSISIKSKTFFLNSTLLNVRSVRNKTVLVTDILTECETDIALLTETWLKDDDQVVMNKITPPGFKNRTTKRGGGVAVLH